MPTVLRIGPYAFVFFSSDRGEPAHEKREIIIGHSDRNRLLLASFTQRGETVRIISARKATRHERIDYEENPYQD